MPVAKESQTITQDPSHEAKAFLSLLWRHMYVRVQSMLHPHHMKHEPGGNDIVKLPIGFLKDVNLEELTDLANGQVLIYRAETSHWINGAGNGGGQAFFEMYPYLFEATIPGPTNITGTSLTIKTVRISSDGQCSGTAAGVAFNFGVGGGTSTTTDLTTAFTSISATVSSAGVGTYLTVDVYFESA